MIARIASDMQGEMLFTIRFSRSYKLLEIERKGNAMPKVLVSALMLLLAGSGPIGFVHGQTLRPPPTYTFQEFNVTGALRTDPIKLNDFNYGVGSAVFGNRFAAILFNVQTGFFREINVPGACSTRPYGLNNKLQVVGTYGVGTCAPGGITEEHMFLLDSDGTFHDIDIGIGSNAAPEGINDQGTVVGSLRIDGRQRGFIMRCKKHGRTEFACDEPTLFDVPTGEEPTLTIAHDVNNKGEIGGEVSSSSTNDFRRHGFVCDKHLNCTLIDFPGAFNTLVVGISRTSVVGSWDGDEAQHSMVCTGGHCFTIDPVSLGATASIANDINLLGWIVGGYSDTNGFPHGYLAKPTQREHDLDSELSK